MEEQTPLKRKVYDSLHCRFTLEQFTRAYVEAAIMLARENLSASEYDRRVVEEVSVRMRMSHEEVEVLQKPFYWGLISNNGNTPLKRIQPRVPGEQTKIFLNLGYDGKISSLVDLLLTEENCAYLDSRIRKLLTQRVDVDIQTDHSTEGDYSPEEVYG